MNAKGDIEEPPLTNLEVAVARKAATSAKKLLRVRLKQAIYASAVFFLSCASVSPFLKGGPLHSQWESFGKFLLLMSMTLLIPFLFFVGRAINAWIYLRDIEKVNT